MLACLPSNETKAVWLLITSCVSNSLKKEKSGQEEMNYKMKTN